MKFASALVALAFVGSACSTAGTESHSTDSTCKGDPKNETTLTAEGTKFDLDCIVVPAGEEFQVNFINKDAFEHNFSIKRSHESTDSLFNPLNLKGPATQTFETKLDEAGTYHFHCAVHPDAMNGVLIAAKAK